MTPETLTHLARGSEVRVGDVLVRHHWPCRVREIVADPFRPGMRLARLTDGCELTLGPDVLFEVDGPLLPPRGSVEELLAGAGEGTL